MSRLSTKQRRARRYRHERYELHRRIRILESPDPRSHYVVTIAAKLVARHLRFKLEALDRRYGPEGDE